MRITPPMDNNILKVSFVVVCTLLCIAEAHSSLYCSGLKVEGFSQCQTYDETKPPEIYTCAVGTKNYIEEEWWRDAVITSLGPVKQTCCPDGFCIINAAEIQPDGWAVETNCKDILPHSQLAPMPCNESCQSREFTWKSKLFEVSLTAGLCDTVDDTYLERVDLIPEGRSVRSYSTCTSSHNITGVLITCSSLNFPIVSVSKSSWSYVSILNSSVLFVEYSVEALVTSAYVYVNVVDQNVILYSESWWEPAQAYCDLLADFICCPRDYYTCTFLYSPYWWLVYVIAILILLFWFVPCTFVMLTAILALLVYPIKILVSLMRRCYYKVRRTTKAAKIDYTKVLVLLCLSTGTLACDSGIVMTSTIENCVTSNGVQTCSVGIDGVVTLPYLHSKTCLTIIDQDGIFLTDVNLTYLSYSEVIQMRHLYYTGPWVGESISSRHCPQVGACTGTKCEDINPNDITAYGELPDSKLYKWPGQTSCDAGCGCAGCGCFYCSSSCIFSRYVLTPVNSTIADVTEPYLRESHPNILVELTDTKYNTILSNTPLIVSVIRLQVLGGLVTDLTEFASNKFIFVNDKVYYGPASSANNPSPLFLGDIQSDNPAYYAEERPDAFIYPPGSIIKTVNSKSVKYTFPRDGFSTLSKYPRLPTTVGTEILTYDGLAVVGNLTNAPPLILSIQTLEPIHITRSVLQVCPSFQFVNGTGCYNCLSGSEVVIYGRSTCYEGVVLLTLSNSDWSLHQTSLHITQENAFYTIGISSPVEHVEVDLVLASSPVGDNQVVHLDYYTLPVELIVPDDPYNTNNQTSPKWDYMSLAFPDLPSWLSISLDILFIIIGIIIIILIIWLIVKCCVKKVKVL